MHALETNKSINVLFVRMNMHLQLEEDDMRKMNILKMVHYLRVNSVKIHIKAKIP